MSLPYSILGNVTGSINTGSFLNEQDTNLFYVTQSRDIWFGLSPNDVVELSTFLPDDDSLVNWSIIDTEKEYKTTKLTFLDSLNIPKTYTFRELIGDFTTYKSQKILINPITDLNAVGITEGSYKVSYNFVRQMAGTPDAPITIKEISPSRTEIKLLPKGDATVSYLSFCLKKFPIRDVAPVLISATQTLPFDQTLRLMEKTYDSDIKFIQSIFFLADLGSVTQFLKNLYEDLVKYTFLSSDQVDAGLEPTRISRIQGIRSYFQNHLLQNLDLVSDFDVIEQKYRDFVSLRLNQAFAQFLSTDTPEVAGAVKFCYDFFVTYFYANIVHPLQTAHRNKYFGLLSNVLNFGQNRNFAILATDFLDERQNPNDPLTLIVKLSAELPSDISPKTDCWVSNFNMTPYVFTVILRNPIKYQTIKISAPNFGTPVQFITKENVNKLYSSDDLEMDSSVNDDVTINKTIANLNTDYSDFSNFVVFSSATGRINIFKNKVIEWTKLSASLVVLEQRQDAAISASTTYPYFTSEQTDIKANMSDLVNSFDGYESYLFNGGNFEYSITTGSFTHVAFLDDYEFSASNYDRANRDSLIANTPSHILNDSNNEDYITFLAMTGHHFDNIYSYISALPVERQVKNESSASLPTKTLKEMLLSFGWNIDDIIGDLNIDEVYLNSLNGEAYDNLSAEQRLQTIWNRILVTLPGIYKTKGTEECVRLLMSAYGLPSSLISIREYGGIDSATDPLPTYKLDEKTYMLKFSGIGDYIQGPIPYTTKTVEFKFAVEQPDTYSDFHTVPLFESIPYPYTSSENAAWRVSLYKTPGEFMGKVMFQMASGSSSGSAITSSALPLFNGEIFSVMVRRNPPIDNFEDSVNSNAVPLDYDLHVQRNEDGRRIFYSTSSMTLQVNDNETFAQFGSFRLSTGTFIGTLDKLSIWNISLDDGDFEEHVNDINSYGYSSSLAYTDLWVRLGWDYPQAMEWSGSTAIWVDNRSPYFALPNYYSNPNDLSSSLDPQLYSASVEIIDGRWRSGVPTGSIEIRAWNFPTVVPPNFTASFSSASCQYESSSVYPFHFRELTYQQDIDASKFGPNKYKNKKIRKLAYSVESRFDAHDRSTFDDENTVSGESNQLGFFIDPQDSKNKDIIRYLGRGGIMEFIADPSNLYSATYEDLKVKNHEYHAAGNKRILFNELLTVYKFYFDKSVFQAIKNVLPARANAFTGVVIEPTILERPKYQNRPINSSATVTALGNVVIDNITNLSSEVLWSSTLSSSYSKTVDLTYLNEGISIKPRNLFDGYVTDEMDNVQRLTYGDYENQVRGWDNFNIGYGWIGGSVSRPAPWASAEIGPHHNPPDGYDISQNKGTHQILYYMVKVWDKYNYYAKTGDYSRTDNPNDDTYASASVSLYKYIMVDERFMQQLIFFFDWTVDVNSPSHIYDNSQYYHRINTFRHTPDQRVSNVHAFNVNPINPIDFELRLDPVPMYYEISYGYPRNHYTHKMTQFSKSSYPRFITPTSSSFFVKGRNTIDTTISETGINDGTFPVQSTNVSNVNVMNATNIIQTVPSTTAGQTVLPNSTPKPKGHFQSNKKTKNKKRIDSDGKVVDDKKTKPPTRKKR